MYSIESDYGGGGNYSMSNGMHPGPLGILLGEDGAVQAMKYKKNTLHKCLRYSPPSETGDRKN